MFACSGHHDANVYDGHLYRWKQILSVVLFAPFDTSTLSIKFCHLFLFFLLIYPPPISYSIPTLDSKFFHHSSGRWSTLFSVLVMGYGICGFWFIFFFFFFFSYSESWARNCYCLMLLCILGVILGCTVFLDIPIFVCVIS